MATLPEALELLRSAIEADFPGFLASALTIQSGGGFSAISLPLIPARAPRPTSTPGNRPNSPTETLILRALADGNWKTGQLLADACGMARSTFFSSVLSNLADAGVIESSTRHGYRLAQTQREGT